MLDLRISLIFQQREVAVNKFCDVLWAAHRRSGVRRRRKLPRRRVRFASVDHVDAFDSTPSRSSTMNDDDDDAMDIEEASSPQTRPLSSIRVFILQSKIDPELMSSLVDDAEGAGMSLVGRAEDAEIIVTEIRMRQRLERHMKWEVAVSA